MENLDLYEINQIKNKNILGRNVSGAAKSKNPLALFWSASGIEVVTNSSELWVQVSSNYSVNEIYLAVQISGYTIEQYKSSLEFMPDVDCKIEDSSFDRLKAFYNSCDLFIFMPGGSGTIGELFGIIEEGKNNLQNKKQYICFSYSFETALYTIHSVQIIYKICLFVNVGEGESNKHTY